MKIVILTGCEWRHQFFRKFMAADEIDVAASYCENQEGSLRVSVEADQANGVRLRHLVAREQSEVDFFRLFVESVEDQSNPVPLRRGSINGPKYLDTILAAEPDLLVAFGCSLIKNPLLSAFSGRFLNVHLGLSPYFRGAGTNYWPLVKGHPEYVGATFMHMDAGVDTGEVIHQIRARRSWGDTPSQVGNRLIVDMARACRQVVLNWERLVKMPPLPIPQNAKVYKQADFTEDSVRSLYWHFRDGMIERYLAEKHSRCTRVPIIENLGVDQ